MNGTEALEALLKEYPDAKVLFLTTFVDDEYIVKALELGAKGYIVKQNYENIIPALKAVLSGQNVYGNEGTSRNYLSSILEKLHLRNRTQLVVFFSSHFS